MTVDCPLDCEYLVEARRHEKPVGVAASAIANQDIRISDSFLRDHEPLVIVCGRMLFEAAATVPGAIDTDVRETLEALIQTYRTLDSGLIYESRPSNPLAAAIQQGFEQRFRTWSAEVTERAGMAVIRDREVMGVLVFLQRLELMNNNGRRRGKAFLDILRGFLPPAAQAPASNLIT